MVRDPRNIIFIFASLSVGIATGVYGYAIALAGTMIFCTVAVLLNYSPYGKSGSDHYDVVFTMAESGGKANFVEFLTQHKIKGRIVRYRTTVENTYRYSFRLIITKDTDTEQFFEEMAKIVGITEIRFSKSEEVEL
jgi:uncharacterized membrane protein YhiD involved in acid resistance